MTTDKDVSFPLGWFVVFGVIAVLLRLTQTLTPESFQEVLYVLLMALILTVLIKRTVE